MPGREETKTVAEKSAHLVSWFFAAVGLIYGCGFLIVFTFFKGYGVDSIVFIEPRYIHVGFLFFMACLVIVVPMWWIVWPVRQKLPHLASFIQEGLLKESKKERMKYFSRPIRRLFFSDWSLDPTHGIHTGWAVIISMILILWSFIILVIFAPRNFGQIHPRLSILNFLIPMLVLAIAVLCDLFKQGALCLSDHALLRLVRFGLKMWWILAGGIYLYVFLTTNWFDFSLWPLAARFFLPPVIIIICLSCALLFHPRPGGAMASMLTRTAVFQWMLYTFQWIVVICQTWMFIWTIKSDTLKLSLWDVLLGKGYLLQSRNAIPSAQGFNAPHGAIYFILLIVLIGIFAIRNGYRIKQITDSAHKTAMIISVAVISVPLFYISILAFSLSVFPYIPYDKGGGDYTRELPVHITFNTNATALTNFRITVPRMLLDESASNHLIMLDENDNFVYLADTNEAGGPESWRSEAYKPTVYEINREVITCIDEKGGESPHWK